MRPYIEDYCDFLLSGFEVFQVWPFVPWAWATTLGKVLLGVPYLLIMTLAEIAFGFTTVITMFLIVVIHMLIVLTTPATSYLASVLPKPPMLTVLRWLWLAK